MKSEPVSCSWEACRERDTDQIWQCATLDLEKDSLATQFEGHLALAFVCCDGTQTPRALAHFRDALFLSEETDSFGHRRLCMVHGLVQRELGEHVLTVHLMEKYTEAVAAVGDQAEQALALELLGMAFFRMGRSAEAHESWNDAEHHAEATGGGARVGIIRGWHGVAYLHQQRWEDAAESFDGAKEIFDVIGPDSRQIYTIAGLATARAKLEDAEQAIVPLQRAVRMAEARLHARQESLWLRYLGEIQMAAGDCEGALESFHRSAEISLRCRLFGRMRAVLDASLGYLEQMGDPRLLTTYRQYRQMEHQLVLQSLADRETSLQLLETIRAWNRKSSYLMLEV